MSRCNDFIKSKNLLYPEFYSKCETCVQWSFKYKDCKLHGDDQGTSVVHQNVKYGKRARR